MTQAEYRENMLRLEHTIKEQKEKIEELEFQTSNYTLVLEQNAGLNSTVNMLRQDNDRLIDRARELEEIIEHYKNILNKVEININN